jgi:hypothetical protein
MKINKKEIDRLKKELMSSDWDIALAASDRFVEIGGNAVVKILIQLLNSSLPSARNAAALALRELKEKIAKKPLISAIMKPEHKNNNGTLISALSELDCSDLFLFFLNIALYGNCEGQSKALMALNDKTFNLDEAQIASARKELNKYCMEYINKPNDWELLIDELKKILHRVADKKGDGVKKSKKQLGD